MNKKFIVYFKISNLIHYLSSNYQGFTTIKEDIGYFNKIKLDIKLNRIYDRIDHKETFGPYIYEKVG